MKWIKCSDGLPESDESVLAFDGECQGVSFYDNEYGDWEITPRIAIITHWMPLPEPPEDT